MTTPEMQLDRLLTEAEVLSVATETVAQDFPSSQFEIPGPTRERITVVLLSDLRLVRALERKRDGQEAPKDPSASLIQELRWSRRAFSDVAAEWRARSLTGTAHTPEDTAKFDAANARLVDAKDALVEHFLQAGGWPDAPRSVVEALR